MDCTTQDDAHDRLGCSILFSVGFLMAACIMPAWFIWASQGRIELVYPAAFLTWTGYLVAHYGAVGMFVDDVETPSTQQTVSTASQTDGSSSYVDYLVPESPLHAIGTVTGIGINIIGIAVGAWAIRQESLSLGLVAGVAFMGGYVIAHYFDSGKPL